MEKIIRVNLGLIQTKGELQRERERESPLLKMISAHNGKYAVF